MHNTLSDSLATFNPETATLLGEGSESRVYALDSHHVLRVCRDGASTDGVAARAALLDEITAGSRHIPFATPQVIEQGEHNGQHVTLENRLNGNSMLNALADASGSGRRMLIEQYMEAAWLLGDVAIERPFYGEICHPEPIEAPSFRAYLAERAERSLATSTDMTLTDSIRIAANVAEPDDRGRLVHLDFCPANVLVEGVRVSAVLDFGYASLIGDRRMTAVAAAAYLVPEITPTVKKGDQAIAFDWLRNHEMISYYTSAERWLAAYWTHASDDENLFKWCTKILG